MMHSSRSVGLRFSLLVMAVLGWLPACAGRKPVHSELSAAAQGADALAVADALEALIDARTDTPVDREYAYAIVSAQDGDTAAALFARAMVTGRLVQQRGLRGAPLIGDIERYARRSRDLDPGFRNAAATRLLGSLYVMAPAVLLTHGDSEGGLELLEGLVAAHPEVPENHLRLAEAYIALSDPTPATPHLCYCLTRTSALRRDDQLLLTRLVADAGTPPCPTTP